MAIKRGHRFPVEHADVFPKGLMLLGPISPDMEYERPNVQKTDPVTGLLQWSRRCRTRTRTRRNARVLR